MIRKLVCASVFTGTLALLVAHAVFTGPTATAEELLVPSNDDDHADDEDHARPARWGRKVEVLELDDHAGTIDDTPAGAPLRELTHEPNHEPNQKKSKASGKRADRIWD